MVNLERLSFPFPTIFDFPVVVAQTSRLLILLFRFLAGEVCKNHHIFRDIRLKTTCGLFAYL